ncbi:chromosome partitioning protein ParB [Nocardioides dubius]|uniref:ParB N-terminal domain-containing protein n=1 Tax=Nocardioides dubius TaxID=317019 RepID=A0ABN1U013_9ACTN
MYNSGSPRADAEADFLRARRQQVLSSIAGRFRATDDLTSLLSFDEVVTALGYRGEKRLGRLVIPLERVVGTVDKTRDFDRAFRPTSGRARSRWERISQALRRGEEVPPIDVYKLGDLYFVRDGHHRVSVAKSLGLDLIEADVTEIRTEISPQGISVRGDLDRRHWRRIFLDRVPLPPAAAAEFDVADPHSYHRLAELVEAWSARRMHAEQHYLNRTECAELWYGEEYLPVRALIEDAGLGRADELPADTYLRVAAERYELTREHTWDVDVLDELARRGRRRG